MSHSATPQQQYETLIEQVITHQEIWILVGGEGSVLLNSEGQDCIPVWPTKKTAEQFAQGDWADCKTKCITLADWQERWTPGLTQDKLKLAANPNEQEESLVVTAEEFDEDLTAATSEE